MVRYRKRVIRIIIGEFLSMIVLVGASASGKTELSKILFQKYGYKKCITTTTRHKREKEVEDVDYHFLSKENFLHKIQEGQFIEVTEYQGEFYGIHKDDINQNGIVIVDPNGANALLRQLPDDVFVVYIKTSADLRRKRMIDRNDELEKINNRIKADAHIFKAEAISRIDLVLSNDYEDLEHLAAKVHTAYQTKES